MFMDNINFFFYSFHVGLGQSKKIHGYFAVRITFAFTVLFIVRMLVTGFFCYGFVYCIMKVEIHANVICIEMENANLADFLIDVLIHSNLH